MTTSHDTAPAKPYSWGQFWQAAILLLAVLVAWQCVDTLVGSLNHHAGRGYLGARIDFYDRDVPGYCEVKSVAPGGPMDQAGVRAGDRLNFDRPYDFIRQMQPGEHVGFVDHRDGHAFHAEATTVAGAYGTPAYDRFVAGYAGLGLNGNPWFAVISILTVLIGAFIVIRSRRKPSALLVGSAYIAFSLMGTGPLSLIHDPVVWAVWFCGLMAIFALPPVLFLAFAIQYRTEQVGRARPWERVVFWSFFVLMEGLAVADFYCRVAVVAFPVVGRFLFSLTTCMFLGFLLATWFLYDGWRRSSREAQRHYALMLVAIVLMMLSRVATMTINWNGNDYRQGNPLMWVAEASCLGGALLFAYAVLRHKVLDLGFAINRALVYGVLSTVLLVLFGVIEWASEHFLPIKNLETNIALNAGVALAIFLVFHRVRDFVEGLIEKLFFSAWHHNEAQLRRFVKQAAFIGKAEALRAAFLAELKRFSGGADVALYLADGADFASDKTRIDGDDAAVVAMKADHAPVEAADHLDLPMIHRAELTGFIRLGLKPSGDSYRPDEREVLSYAAHQIGLDLHALRVEALEAKVATLDAQLAFAAGLAKGSSRAQARSKGATA